MDKLDLLGVRHDYEMELKARHEIAKKVSDEVKEECTDTNVMSNEFYVKCIDKICDELGENGIGEISSDVYEIWNIIEKDYL